MVELHLLFVNKEVVRDSTPLCTSLCLLWNSAELQTLSGPLHVYSGTPDSFLTLVRISCLHQTLQIPSDWALHIHTYTYISPHVLSVAPRLIEIISPLWISCRLLVALIRYSTAAPYVFSHASWGLLLSLLFSCSQHSPDRGLLDVWSIHA